LFQFRWEQHKAQAPTRRRINRHAVIPAEPSSLYITINNNNKQV